MNISEFLPNPAGKDTDGEFIELFNSGGESITLNSWKLKDASDKTFTFTNQVIDPGGYLVLDYKTTKISLNNNGETLYLYDNQNNLIDKAEYVGTAEAGKSLIRKDNRFVFTDKPTPGKPNIFEGAQTGNRPTDINTQNLGSLAGAITRDSADFPALVRGGGINTNHLFLGIAVALILASLFIIIWKKLNVEKEF